MKYSIEFKDGKFIETLEVDGHTATKTWKREKDGNLNCLQCHDKEFYEQLEEMFEEDVTDGIYETFDNNLWVADIEDFIMLNNVE